MHEKHLPGTGQRIINQLVNAGDCGWNVLSALGQMAFACLIGWLAFTMLRSAFTHWFLAGH